MDAASILLILATAGQSGWTSEPTAPATISAAPNGGRYGATPATTTQQVQDWAQQAGQDQLNAASNALRETGNRAAESVSNQVNGQLQQFTNPFSTSATPSTTTSTQPAAAQPRGSVAPPPWANVESAWADNESQPAATPMADPTRSAGMVPTQTEGGWTSISSGVAAPPLLVPRLATNNPTISPPPAQPAATAAAATGPSFPTSSVNREPITNAAVTSTSQPPPANTSNDWSNGWGDFNASQPSIAANNAAQPFNNTVSTPTITAPNSGSRTLNLPDPPALQPAAQAQSPPPANGFRNMFAENPNQPAAAPARENNVLTLGNPTAAAPPITISAPPAAPAGGSVAARPIETTPIIAQAAPAVPAGKTTGDKPGEAQPPWLPLIAVSLALAGSVSANFFLGWSYMDARQKYQTLVRKTADTFRRVAAAA